jgi:hypothetical protein
MLFIYHLLCEAPTTCNKKSDGLLVVPLNFSLNVIKIIVEMVAIWIILDIATGGLIQDEALQEALIEYFRICLTVVVPLSVSVLSCMIFSEVMIPNEYTEDDRVL